MQILVIAAGVAVLSFTVLDFVWTALSMQGAGPLTGRLSRAVWQLLLRLPRMGNRSLWLMSAGPIILGVNLIGWVLLTWIGWTMIFLGAQDAVLDATLQQPAEFWDRVYFAGTAISTLGVGDFVAGTPLWRFLATISALNGLVLITSAITYIVSVLNAVIQKRTLAASISILSETPQDIVISHWNGHDFAEMEALLSSFPNRIIGFAQQHLAYPVLNYFTSRQAATALAPSLARLDEALTLLRCGVPAEVGPAPRGMAALRKAIALWLDTMVVIERNLPRDPPAPPDLAALRLAGVPTLSEAVYLHNVRALVPRRRMMLYMVIYGGWDWEDVTAPALSAFDLTEEWPPRHHST